VLASLVLMASVFATDAVPAFDEGSYVRSDRVVQLVVALAQAEADFSLKQSELGLTGSAPLVGLEQKQEAPSSSVVPASSPAAASRPLPHPDTAVARPASTKRR
jgi:hypothetical protein